ncbi:MAG: TfoX/Sxy family transcriptional regulator of competence genes [Planctomycetota bacterium]|jgi:TfoX/Sxy family transcriptional regulator of competence genes
MVAGQEIVDRVLLQLAPLQVRARAMFGGHCIYCDGKVVALVCDDQVFIKPTAKTVAWHEQLESAPPYPGAKHCLVASDSLLLDRIRLRELVQATAHALPKPKPRWARQLVGKQAKK